MNSVLPPPPRYPTQNAYGTALPSGMPVPMIETSNVLSHPVGPEYQLLVGEGNQVPAVLLFLPIHVNVRGRYIRSPGRFASGDASTSSFRGPYHKYKSISDYTGSSNSRGQVVVGYTQPSEVGAAAVQAQYIHEHSVEFTDI